jgi:hypothetical protein
MNTLTQAILDGAMRKYAHALDLALYAAVPTLGRLKEISWLPSWAFLCAGKIIARWYSLEMKLLPKSTEIWVRGERQAIVYHPTVSSYRSTLQKLDRLIIQTPHEDAYTRTVAALVEIGFVNKAWGFDWGEHTKIYLEDGEIRSCRFLVHGRFKEVSWLQILDIDGRVNTDFQ